MASNRPTSHTAKSQIMGAMVMGQNILTAAHRQLLAEISRDRYLTDTFYFTGGTALSAYYLRHRYSEDLDFFCEAPYDKDRLRIASLLDIAVNKVHAITTRKRGRDESTRASCAISTQI